MATTPKRPATRRAKPAATPRSRSAAPRKTSAHSAAAKKEARDSHGRFASDKRTRNLALGVGGTIVALGAGIGTALWRGWVKMPRGPWGDREGHEAPDLALDAPKPGTMRAPDAFRPDPTAVPTAQELDGLRPATGPGNGWS